LPCGDGRGSGEARSDCYPKHGNGGEVGSADKDAGDIYGFLAGKGAVISVPSPAISSGEWGELMILVDTHVVVWLAASGWLEKARAAIDVRPEWRNLAICASRSELAALFRKDRIDLNQP
jgi:hypothetical protein